MKVAFDIDGVIAKDLNLKELNQGRDKEIYGNLTFDENSRQVLENLENCKIYFITARRKEFASVTKQWLQKHGIYYDKIFFSPYWDWRQSPQFKTEVVKREGVDILIDDFPQNIIQVNKNTDCQGILFRNWKKIDNRLNL